MGRFISLGNFFVREIECLQFFAPLCNFVRNRSGNNRIYSTLCANKKAFLIFTSEQQEFE